MASLTVIDETLKLLDVGGVAEGGGDREGVQELVGADQEALQQLPGQVLALVELGLLREKHNN